MTGPRYTPLALSLPATVPFVGPETQERAMGQGFRARIGANESVFGPSPKAIAAIADAAPEAWMYPDPEGFELRQALASFHGVGMENVTLGEGIDGLLGTLVRLLVEPGDAVVTSDGAYPTFNYHVAGFGGALHKVPYRDDAENLPALLAKAAEVDAKLVYFANPDNPMGSWAKAADVVAALDAIPQGCLLILDEAYVELAPDGTAVDLPIEDPRLIRMRTFSKAYGLAGLRVGYALGATDLIRSFDKVRNHFGVTRVGQAAAMAALADQGWMDDVRARVGASRDRLAEIARAAGLTPLPSATNFVTIDCGKDGDFARAVLQNLVAQGIFVRMPFVVPGDRCIRVSCAPEPDIQLFADALPKALEAAAQR